MSSSFSYDIPAYSAVSILLRDSDGGNPDPNPTPTPSPSPTPTPDDTTAPSRTNLQPSGTLLAGTTQATLSLTTNESATCKYSTSVGISYNSMSNTFDGAGGTSHTRTVSALQNGQSYIYYVRCQDAAGNANGSDTQISFSVASPSQQPPSAQLWPAKVDLSVGESYSYTLMDGTQRTLKLLSYNIIIPRHKVEATIQVSGNGKTQTHTLQVAMAGVPVSINGLRVYGYAWREANDFGFEDVGITGGFPMESGKAVGFAVSDASGTMFPDMDAYTYPVDTAFFENAGFQSFLEPAGDDNDLTNWAHAGYDIGVPSGRNLVALTDGVVWNQLDGNPNSMGIIWLSTSNGEKWGDPETWLFTHVKQGSVTVPAGTFVTKGTILGEKCSTCGGFHMGSKNSRDFGSWLFSAEIWNHEHREGFPAPRHWLVLGPYAGDIDDNHIYSNESGNIPSTLLPREGGADKDGGKTWKFRDNFVNSVVLMEELLSTSPFSGYNVDRNSKDSVGYAATYVFSPDSHATDGQVWLRYGSNRNAKIWLNGSQIFTKSAGSFEIDEHSVALPLKKGWNTLIIKTDNGSDEWQFSAKIGDSSGNRIAGIEFSARDIGLTASSVSENHVSINWSAPEFTGTFVESYMLDVATDAGFNNLVISERDLGKVTSHTISGLNSGQDYHIRVKPYSYSEMGGSVYWQHVDAISARTEGLESVLPSTAPPGGLDPSEVPLFITLGSDDNNDSDGVNFLVDELLGGKLNPAGAGNPATYDGAPLLGTFYLIGIHETYSQGLCNSHRNAYLKGHEIGNHAYENEGGLTLEGWLDSLSKTNGYISRAGGCGATPRGVGVPSEEIYGFRAPQDNYNVAMYAALEQLGFTYSASTAVGRRADEDGTNYPWPGTLDEGYPLADWQTDPGVHPGFWEVPQNVMQLPPSLGGGSVGYCDLDWFWEWGDDPDGGAAKIAEMLKHNLDLHLNGNRSPMHLCLHGDAWGKKSWEPERTPGMIARQGALQEFIEYALTKPQVRVVRQIDVINWMRNPVALGVSGDETAPTAPTGLTAVGVSQSRIDLSWSAASDPESGVTSYNVYRDGVKVASGSATGYSDTNLEEGATYSYQVSAVNGFGMEGQKSSSASATTLSDAAKPTISSVSASGDAGVVTIVFSEAVEQASATNKNNYSINNGISVQSASLAADLKTVTLSTSSHSEDVTYTLTVNSVKDRATNPNTIAANSQESYTYT
ncbi:MAG: fibronectin type III domain-containing protein, partial [Ardenticatenaceae bacterium]